MWFQVGACLCENRLEEGLVLINLLVYNNSASRIKDIFMNTLKLIYQVPAKYTKNTQLKTWWNS